MREREEEGEEEEEKEPPLRERFSADAADAAGLSGIFTSEVKQKKRARRLSPARELPLF